MESSLLNLDVFHHIGEHIAQKEALVALCSVCKDLNRIFTPRLYAHLRIHNIAMMKKFRGNDLNKTKYITLGEPLGIPTGEKVLPLPPILEQGPMFVPNGDTGLRLLDDDDVEGLLCGILLNCENLESLVYVSFLCNLQSESVCIRTRSYNVAKYNYCMPICDDCSCLEQTKIILKTIVWINGCLMLYMAELTLYNSVLRRRTSSKDFVLLSFLAI